MSELSKEFIERVKTAAKGRWRETLVAAGFPGNVLDGKNHPCPKPDCGGTDRFFAFDDVNERGAVMCRQCHAEQNGDGIAAIEWWLGCSFGEALEFVSKQVGIRPHEAEAVTLETVVEQVAALKRIPPASFKKFGARAAKRGGLTVARVPVYSQRGIQHSYFDIAFDPNDKGKFKRGKKNGGIFLPEGRTPKPGDTWLLPEGVKDAAALDSLGYLAAGLPNKALPVGFAQLFAGVNIVLVPDLDDAGSSGANQSATRLLEFAASVRIAKLPGEHRKTGGEDVRDCLARIDGETLLRDAISSAIEWQPIPGATHERPTVIVSHDEASVTEAVLEHLSQLGFSDDDNKLSQYRVYQRGGKLVHITCDPVLQSAGITIPPATPQIAFLPKSILRERIGLAVRLIKVTERNGEEVQLPAFPPDWLLSAIHERGQYPSRMRYLSGIVRCPTLRPGGTVIQEVGYDAATGLVYLPDLDYPLIPDNPTRDDACRCAEELRSIYCDFPFVDEHHKSVALALVLTLVARPAISGQCPFFAFDATTPGSGKGKLCDVASTVVFGFDAPRRSLPSTDDEMSKVVTAVGMEGTPLCLFDNAATVISFSSLESVTTSNVWCGRLLCTSETTGNLAMFTVWIVTGNNLVIGGDMFRRTLYCRLESPLDNPEERTDFVHADLIDYVRQNRARLAVAAVTVLRAYFSAGCPPIELDQCSFPEWSKIVRAAMVWLDLHDPVTTREALRQSDSSAESLGLLHSGLLEAAPQGQSITAQEIYQKLMSPNPNGEADRYPTLRAAVAGIGGGPAGFTANAIGYLLRKHKGRIRGGKSIQAAPGHGGIKRWYLGENVVDHNQPRDLGK